MNRHLARVMLSLAVLGWAVTLLYFCFSGRVTKYLAPDFRPLCLAGGLGLAVLGLFNLLARGGCEACAHGDCGGDAHDHESSDVHPLAAVLLLVVPLALAVGFTKDGFSQAALARKGLYTATPVMSLSFAAGDLPPLTLADVEKTHRRAAGGHLEFNLLELFFAAGDRDLKTILEGKKVVTQGRIVAEKVRNPHGTRMRLYRLFSTCCAADGRAVPIVLEFGRKPDEFPENSWVEAAGTMRFLIEDGQPQPVLEVENVTPATAPYEENFKRKW